MGSGRHFSIVGPGRTGAHQVGTPLPRQEQCTRGYVSGSRCFADPMSRAADARQATAMLSKPTCRDAADQLLLGAAALERVGRNVAVESLPDDLEELGEAL